MRRVHTAALIGATLVLFLTICYRILGTPFWNVNGSRLMPAFALSQGINYYVLFPPGGPLYSTLYGPMVAVIYLPATLFPAPNSAVLAGSAITVLMCFLSVAFLHFAPSAHRRGLVDWLAFLTAGLLICYLDPLAYSCFNIHADGPGLAFAAIACAALYPGVRERFRFALPVSSLCAVLSILCKQMFLPVPVALLVYLLAVEGRRPAIRYTLWLAVTGGATVIAALIACGPERLYHCLIWIPGRHPWNDASRLVSWAQAARQLIRLSMPVPLVWLACAIYFCTGGQLRPDSLRALAANRCVPVLLVGIALVPFSILGRAKLGGDINSLSFASFFLTCGLTLMLADLAQRAADASNRRMAISVLVALVAPVAIYEAPLSLDVVSRIRQLPLAPQEVAFRYLRRHPGDAYFPWFPLAHLYAEHEFRHYSLGIFDRLIAAEPVTTAEFRAYVPKTPRIIVFGDDGKRYIFGYDLMTYLPEYDRPVRDPELPGWLAYAKSPAGQK